MADIKDQKLLYHLTDINNIPSILKDGLMPRVLLDGFVDIADGDILESREGLGLENHVPFHFFANSPFDGRVQLDNADNDFVIITVRRDKAKGNGWKIIPRHPLAGQELELMPYDDGFNAINWQKMNERDYNDTESKSVCMAECLSPNIVEADGFCSIYVKNAAQQQQILAYRDAAKLDFYVNDNSLMFVNHESG